MPRYALRDRRLTASDRLVLGAIVRRVGSRVWKRISLRRLARYLHLGDRTVRDAVRRLVRCEYLNAEPRAPGTVGRYGVAPRHRGGNWVGIPQQIVAADLPPLTRLTYGVVLHLAGGNRKRLSQSGIGRELRAGAAAVAAAFARLAAEGWLLVERAGRGCLAALTPAHRSDWKQRRKTRVFRQINGVFGAKPATSTKTTAPLLENHRTQDRKGEKYLRKGEIPSVREVVRDPLPPTPAAFAPDRDRLGAFSSVYPGPLDDSRRIGFLIDVADANGVPFSVLIADAERYAGEVSRARRRPEHVAPASEWVERVTLFHVKHAVSVPESL